MFNVINLQGNATLNHGKIHCTPIRMAKIFSFKLTILSDVKKVKQLELSYIPGRNAKWYNHLKTCLAVSYIVKHTHHMTYQSYL